MTGAGLALPLFAASGAQAADTATWDKVAQCESGGVWSAASGNGYYGGLQLTQEMWDNYGGTAYASRPDLASRSQQIAVAESILDHKGPDAWPSCAVNAGLTDDGRAPEVDPGSTSTPEPDPSDSAGSLDPWDTGSSHDHDGTDTSGRHDEPGDAPGDKAGDEPGGRPSDATPSPDASDSGEPGDASTSPEPSGDRDGDQGSDQDSGQGDDDPSQSADPSDGPAADPSEDADHSGGGSRTDGTGTPREVPGKGKHRGGADGEDAGDGDAGRSAGRHASRGGDAHRTGPAADGDYTVRPGDSLSAIAAAHRLSGGWSALYDRNEGVIGSDADLIQPGQRLDLGRNAG
ncbi:transglycosylase family protein [Streptomyces sp. NPDC048612]|uniref:transglycosylase family protein n=1 Tax=Streptomyces sp. NPDC048612 TaxID=3365579 RepID=UPI003711EA79